MKQSRIRKLNRQGYEKFLSGISETTTPVLYKTIKSIIENNKK